MLETPSRRIVFVVAALFVAMGLAIEAPFAASLDDACLDICVDECAEEGGCEFHNMVGCDCHWECDNGAGGVRYCTS